MEKTCKTCFSHLMFCFHKWSKWEEYYNHYQFRMTGLLVSQTMQQETMPGRDLRQRRSCLKCGKSQDKLIEEMV